MHPGLHGQPGPLEGERSVLALAVRIRRRRDTCANFDYNQFHLTPSDASGRPLQRQPAEGIRGGKPRSELDHPGERRHDPHLP